MFESIFSLPEFNNPLSPLLQGLVDPSGTPLDGIFSASSSASVLDTLDSLTSTNGIDQIFKRTSDKTSLKTIYSNLVTDKNFKRNIGIDSISTIDLGKRIKILLALAKLASTSVNNQGDVLVNFSAAASTVSDKTVTVKFFDGTEQTVSLSDFNKYRISKEKGKPLDKITGLRYIQDIKGQLEIAAALLKAQIVV